MEMCYPAPDPGMDLGLGVVVRTVAENGLAANNGVKPGDELYQVGVVKSTLGLRNYYQPLSAHTENQL